jgi:hypothetical protein
MPSGTVERKSCPPGVFVAYLDICMLFQEVDRWLGPEGLSALPITCLATARALLRGEDRLSALRAAGDLFNGTVRVMKSLTGGPGRSRRRRHKDDHEDLGLPIAEDWKLYTDEALDPTFRTSRGGYL